MYMYMCSPFVKHIREGIGHCLNHNPHNYLLKEAIYLYQRQSQTKGLCHSINTQEHTYTHVLMRDAEGRKKEASKVKQITR